MEKTSRRNLLRAAAVGGAAATGLGVFLGSERAAAQDGEQHRHNPETAPRPGHAQATVAFGQWIVDVENPFDRYPNISAPPTRNVHAVLPFEAEIDEGGSVNFIISGTHQILIYQGLELADMPRPILAGDPRIVAGGPGLVNIPEHRVYRGLSPVALTYYATNPTTGAIAPLQVQDRVESVNFPTAGRYLVICGLLPHYNEGMHGFVNVKERD